MKARINLVDTDKNGNICFVEYDTSAIETVLNHLKELEKERDGIYQDYQDLGKEYHKLQEESISKAVVEDRVKELKLIREEEEKTRFVLSYSIYNAITNEIDDLEQILNKGE